jgi:hypothetical protein
MQILAVVPTMSVGAASTVTRCVSVAVQPLAAVPVTVYKIVAGGPATGLAQVVHDRPVPGDHR